MYSHGVSISSLGTHRNSPRIRNEGVIDKGGTDTKFLHTKGLLVAKALVCTVPVRIVNPDAQSCKLYKNTIVATYEPNEPEQLISVNTTQSIDTLADPCNERRAP